MATKDSRPYLKLSLDFVNHPKVLALPVGIRWVLLELWTHCAQYRTDGYVDDRTMRRLATPKRLEALISSGFVRDSDEISTGFRWKMHDYLSHQMSRAEQDEKARISRSNGKKGGRPRNPAGFQNKTQLATQNEPEVEVEVEVPTYVGTSAARNVAGAGEQPHEVSTHFADGTPIPGTGATASVVPIHRDRSPAPTSAANALAATFCPTGTPGRQIRDLATVVQELIDDPGVQRPDLEAALAAWRDRPGAGARLLPSLVTDAAKARAGGTAGPPGARPEAKQRTYANLIQKLESQAAQHQEIEQ